MTLLFEKKNNFFNWLRNVCNTIYFSVKVRNYVVFYTYIFYNAITFATNSAARHTVFGGKILEYFLARNRVER